MATIWVVSLPYLGLANHDGPDWQASQQQQVSVGVWFSLSPQGAPFSVTLPAEPAEKAEDIGSGIRMRSYCLKSGQSEYCVIWMSDLPKSRLRTGSLNFLLERALADMLKSARQAGKKDMVTTQDKDVTFNQYKGRKAVMESASDKIEAKGYIVGNEFVALAVMHPKEEEASGEAGRFFDSFTLSGSRPATKNKTGD
jgi:hypothetical protein